LQGRCSSTFDRRCKLPQTFMLLLLSSQSQGFESKLSLWLNMTFKHLIITLFQYVVCSMSLLLKKICPSSFIL
jgi:hypothetical protein